MRDWMSTQPKMETLELAQGTIKRGAQTWHTISEDEKQVCALIGTFSRSLNVPIAIPGEISCPAGRVPHTHWGVARES